VGGGDGGVARLTVEEAVVLEAASAEERVEGVEALLPLHRARVGPVDVGRALRGECTRERWLCQLLVPDTHTHTHTHTHI